MDTFFLCVKESMMRRFYTAGSVTKGHPTKCNPIVGIILDACLKEDANAHVTQSPGYDTERIYGSIKVVFQI